MNTLPTIIGLCIALGGPALLFTPVHRLFGNPESVTTKVLELLFLWLLCGSIWAIVVWWEKRPMSSIGLQLRWQSVAWGLVLAAVLVYLVSPFLYWMLKTMGTAGFEGGLARLAHLPVWVLVFAAVTAGVVEETLYRGYAIERLALITGSYWWAGVIATAIFALVHLPVWGWGPVFTFFLSGGLLALFYIWRRGSPRLHHCACAHGRRGFGFRSLDHALTGRMPR